MACHHQPASEEASRLASLNVALGQLYRRCSVFADTTQNLSQKLQDIKKIYSDSSPSSDNIAACVRLTKEFESLLEEIKMDRDQLEARHQTFDEVLGSTIHDINSATAAHGNNDASTVQRRRVSVGNTVTAGEGLLVSPSPQQQKNVYENLSLTTAENILPPLYVNVNPPSHPLPGGDQPSSIGGSLSRDEPEDTFKEQGRHQPLPSDHAVNLALTSGRDRQSGSTRGRSLLPASERSEEEEDSNDQNRQKRTRKRQEHDSDSSLSPPKKRRPIKISQIIKIMHSVGRTREELQDILRRNKKVVGGLFVGKGAFAITKDDVVRSIVTDDQFIQSRDDPQVISVQSSRVLQVLASCRNRVAIFYNPRTISDKLFYIGHFHVRLSSVERYCKSDSRKGRGRYGRAELTFADFKEAIVAAMKEG